MPRTRPISWPDIDGLSREQIAAELAVYNAATETKPPRSASILGLSIASLSQASTMREAETMLDDRCDSNGKTALRADDIRILVSDRPRAQIDADKWPGGGSHSRPQRTQVVRSLTSEDDLLDTLDSVRAASIMVACDSLASPNQAPKRREILHSAGQTVQRHVISQPVAGELLPARQVVDASEAGYVTVEVNTLTDTYVAENGVVHSRPVTLSCLMLNFGIDHDRNRTTFGRQLEAAIRAIQLAVAVLDLQFPPEPSPTMEELEVEAAKQRRIRVLKWLASK